MGRQQQIGAAGARSAICPAAIASLIAVCSAARADQWLIRGQASEQLVFDSNIRLSNTNRESVFGSITALSADVGLSTPRADIGISGQGSIARYTQDPALNSENFGLTLHSLYRFTRSVFGLGASLQRASTLTTEPTNAGDFTQIANQLSMAVQPSWQYQLSPRNTISIDGSWSRQTYDRGTFANATTYGIGVSWIHQRSAIDTLSVAARVAYLISDGPKSTTRTQSYSVLLGWNTSLTDRLAFSVSAGPRLAFQSESVLSGGTHETVLAGADVDLALIYRLSATTGLRLSGGQTLEPSSAGGVEQRQRIDLSVNHQLSPRMQLSLAASLQHNGAGVGFSNNTVSKNRLYFTTGATMGYQISPTLGVSANYAFRGQQSDRNQSFAVSHAVSAVLTYSPRGWILGH